MKLLRSILILFCFTLCAEAQITNNRITISITVTNGTTNGMFITVNNDTRTFTNQLFNTAQQVGTNSTAGGTATNLYNQIALSPFNSSSLQNFNTGTNFQLLMATGVPASVSVGAGWASVLQSTQQVTSMYALRLPIDGEPNPSFRVTQASNTAYMLNEYAPGGIVVDVNYTNGGIYYSGAVSPNINSIMLGNVNQTIQNNDNVIAGGVGGQLTNYSRQAFLIGGDDNLIGVPYPFYTFNCGIAGGEFNTIGFGIDSVIVGGKYNFIQPNYAGISAGNQSVIAGGLYNELTTSQDGTQSTANLIGAGESNNLAGVNGFAAGFFDRITPDATNDVALGEDCNLNWSEVFGFNDGTSGVLSPYTNNEAFFHVVNGMAINETYAGPGEAFGVNGNARVSQNLQAGYGGSSYGFIGGYLGVPIISGAGSFNLVSDPAFAGTQFGTGNIGYGFGALINSTNGNGNTAVGYDALNTSVVNSNNTAVGFQAGSVTGPPGSSNIYIGAYVLGVAGENNQIYIGNTQTTNHIAGINANPLSMANVQTNYFDQWFSWGGGADTLQVHDGVFYYNGQDVLDLTRTALWHIGSGTGGVDVLNNTLSDANNEPAWNQSWRVGSDSGGVTSININTKILSQPWTLTNPNNAIQGSNAVFYGVCSTATNLLSVGTSGITNSFTGKELRVFQFTGVSVFQTNNLAAPGLAFSRGTITVPTDITLQPGEALVGATCAGNAEAW